jgi:hypothetical protein
MKSKQSPLVYKKLFFCETEHFQLHNPNLKSLKWFDGSLMEDTKSKEQYSIVHNQHPKDQALRGTFWNMLM